MDCYTLLCANMGCFRMSPILGTDDSCRVTKGLYTDNGKEHGNYYRILGL